MLIWGGSGGLGSQAIQLVKHAGRDRWRWCRARAGEYCKALGAVGYIDRTRVRPLGIPPHWDGREGQKHGRRAVARFGKKIWDVIGERRSPDIVFEHPGEATIPTSIFVCEDGGMVVICAGTTGYSAMVDLRTTGPPEAAAGLTRDQRRAGSRIATIWYALAALIRRSGTPSDCEEPPFTVRYQMGAGENVHGSKVALVGASEPRLGRTAKS